MKQVALEGTKLAGLVLWMGQLFTWCREGKDSPLEHKRSNGEKRFLISSHLSSKITACQGTTKWHLLLGPLAQRDVSLLLPRRCLLRQDLSLKGGQRGFLSDTEAFDLGGFFFLSVEWEGWSIPTNSWIKTRGRWKSTLSPKWLPSMGFLRQKSHLAWPGCACQPTVEVHPYHGVMPSATRKVCRSLQLTKRKGNFSHICKGRNSY